MPRVKPSRDIRPVSGFRASAARFMAQVRETGAPVYLTQNGRGAAVLLDVGAYEAMTEELALLRDVRAAESQIAAGKTSSHATVMKRLRKRLSA